MVPYANYRETINNINCFDETKGMYGPSIYDGCFVFIGSTYVKFPMGWMYYSGYYIKNGVRTDFKDSLFIQENANNEWVFEY
ncbi:MAG: hypothetical protein HYU67_12105 [Flavobacteriia bacterium]|nr:hypothetical protein [Flavobacteriia bacterium]